MKINKDVSTTSCLKNQQLTFKEKQYVMLKDLEVELHQYRKQPRMEWWCLTLERKIKEMQDAI